MAAILVLHGPNLNLLGSREPHFYGPMDLATLDKRLVSQATTAGHRLEAFQSNAEHLLIERIHQAKQALFNLIILNPAAFTHTSIALRDALLGVAIPFIEVHLSNIFARESFRHQSFFSDIALGTLSGFGPKGYELALEAAIFHLSKV